MTLRTRMRSDTVSSHVYDYSSSPTITTPIMLSHIPLHEVCVDEVHKNYPSSGGPLSVRKEVRVLGHSGKPQGLRLWAAGGYEIVKWYSAAYLPVPTTNFSVVPSQTTLDSQAKDWGAEAWNKFRPKPSKFQLGESLAEMRSSFDMIRGTLRRIRKYKRIPKPNFKFDMKTGAGSYVAYQFGWKPFVNDLIRLVRLIKNYDEALQYARKINGVWIRKGGILKEESTSDCTGPFTTVRVVPSAYSSNHSYYQTVTKSEKVWFKGCFRYYIPGLEDDRFVGRLKSFPTLAGLSPAVLWEVMPWSWLADWFGNVGDIVNNIDASINHALIAKYAYIMRTTQETITWDYDCTFRTQVHVGTSNPPPIYTKVHLSSSKSYITKTRVAASPYGFNLDWPDFTNWQVSILAALGIQRLL